MTKPKQKDFKGMEQVLTQAQKLLLSAADVKINMENLKTRFKDRTEELTAYMSANKIPTVKAKDEAGFTWTFTPDTKTVFKMTRKVEAENVKADADLKA